MIYTESPRRKQITQQVAWGHWFAFANILLAIVISSVYLFSTPIADTPISLVYLITTWLGHASFLTFLGFVILVLPLCYQITNIKILKPVASVIAAICLALLAFDALLYNKTGFHLSLSSADLLKSEARGEIGAFGWLQWFYLILLFIIWLMFQLVLANAIFKRLHRFQKLKFGPYIVITLVLCFITSHAIHVWADAKLYTPVLKQDNMFPLSYPATAKTLMARYGLLDLTQREQQEQLQYDSENFRFIYPPQQVYCSVDNSKKVVVLASLDVIENPLFNELTQNQYHLNIVDTNEILAQQLLYGLPTNLLSRVTGPAVVSELLNAFEVNTDTFIDGQDNRFDEFSNQVINSPTGFFLGVVNQKQLAQLSNLTYDNTSLLVVIHKTDDNAYQLKSNIPGNTSVSANEDIAPSVLQAFGCMAEPIRYSTGQPLQSPVREWLVTTKGNDIVVLRYPLLTQVAIDGSYEVVDLTEQKKVLVDLDTNLLSRAIKHLRDFSDR